VISNLGHDVDEFMLHIYAPLGEKGRRLISVRTCEALGVFDDRFIVPAMFCRSVVDGDA
jgi:hypothetical protein